MTTLSAYLYDGKTAQRRNVTVKLTVPGYIVLQEFSTLSRFRLEDVDISEQLGSQPARVELPDGAHLEIADSGAFYTQLTNSTGRSQWLHKLESRWSFALLALLLTLALGWVGYVWGVPKGAQLVANMLPLEVDDAIGIEGLAMLDGHMLAPSELDMQRQLQLMTVFISVVETVGVTENYRYQLVFRKGQRLGANALALPGGTIVITDELVALAEHDDELAAILAHEVGHIRNRHALRSLLQNSVVAGLIIVLTGDTSSATSFAAGIPTLLANAGYSREFEYEADKVAREYLLANGIPLNRFATIILRLGELEEGGPDAMSLLSTHPEASERARSF
ncbi:MAG: M48 family metallopeptidase [Gammaproteobacteria bacterium]|nr:M48 family metallopeptidase [Gammaproteobacteria bacterium]MCP4088257.1 M48 family metallopeptidase [Gammaproteobacteria bacterium]MCP4276432.1 M48 family metallopeptidase [Gammaproteobacteria bacterium]MCP4831079.1 M48 family metallopeptidase [Gammaproteobacteria bacterium]MCP4929347.1 M48 family metallopeptidase [Gammaproteobacteria bacterium]